MANHHILANNHLISLQEDEAFQEECGGQCGSSRRCTCVRCKFATNLEENSLIFQILCFICLIYCLLQWITLKRNNPLLPQKFNNSGLAVMLSYDEAVL